MKKSLVTLFSSVTLFTLYLLFTGSKLLNLSIFSIPLGNILMAISIIGLAYIALSFEYQKAWIKRITLVQLVVSLIWFPCSVIIAGNPNFNFSSSSLLRPEVWQMITACHVLISLVIIISTGIYRSYKHFKAKKASS